MPPMDYQGSSAPFASLGRSIRSIRHADGHQELGSSLEQELDDFQRHVADLFSELSLSSGEELLSLLWVRKLLDAYLLCQEEFRFILFSNRTLLSRPPMDRFISDFFDRSVKALDVCNAIRDGIEQVRQWQKQMEIVLVSLECRRNPMGEGQMRRAKKALSELALLMLDGKDSAFALAQRNRSFSRGSPSSSKDPCRPGGHFRSLSWSVSRSWSASKQLQAIGNNINAPRGHEVVATSGLANSVFTMSSVLHFVMWALVAAIPCQDRGLQAHFSIPRNYTWGSSLVSLHDRIIEESKKRERKNSVGLLKEIHYVEKCTCHLLELTDSVQFPLAELKEVELRQRMQELTNVYDAMKKELDPLEHHVREVFHRIVRSRTEGLNCLHNQE